MICAILIFRLTWWVMILKCTKPILKWTVLLVMLASLCTAFFYVASAVRGTMEIGVCLIFSIIFTVPAIGLYRMLKWGRQMAVTLLWLAMLGIIIGRISPQRLENFTRHGGAAPGPLYLIVTSFLALVIFLTALHVLGKHKKEFRAEWF